MANTFRSIQVKAGNLGDLIVQLQGQEFNSGLDKVRSVLALRMNQYSDIDLSEQDMQGIAKAFLDIELGTSTGLVAICSKRKCLYQTRCALYVADKAPEGRECLHENKIMSDSMDRYLQSLDINMNNYPEMVMVNQLVEYELIEHRCNAILSNQHFDMRMTTVIGIDESGNVVSKEDISYALSVKEKIQKLKFQLLGEFTATRREDYKKKVAMKITKDTSQAKLASALRRSIVDAQKEEVTVDAVRIQSVMQDDY
jgi:hypothetical protein